MIVEENYPLVWHIVYKLQRKHGIDRGTTEEDLAQEGSLPGAPVLRLDRGFGDLWCSRELGTVHRHAKTGRPGPERSIEAAAVT